MAATFELIRPDDLLNLRIDATNLRLDASNAQDPVLVVENPRQPALLAITFPPQTITETAYFEASIVKPDGNPNADPRRPPDGTAGDPLPVPGTPGPNARAVAELAHPSRVVFAVPAGTRIPLSLAGLTQWSGLRLHLNPIAAVPPNPTDQQVAAAPGIAEPATNETALELPYRLWISPNADVVWLHRPAPFASRGRTELWHTRLALKAADGAARELSRDNPAPLRALWSPDYHADEPPSVTALDDDLGRTAMSKNDRHQIVVLTAAFHGYQVETDIILGGLAAGLAPARGAADARLPAQARSIPFRFVGPYLPLPFEAEQLMLSPLGGWLKSRGHWNPPYQVIDIPIPRLDPGKLLSAVVRPPVPPRVPPRGAHAAASPAATLAAERLWRFTLKGYQLDLSEWVHHATQGRDHYVRIVYEGELWPGRFPAALIKVSERKFRDTPDGGIGAYLIQHMFVVVRKPVQIFDDDTRAMLLKRVELTTRVTPDIAAPDIPFNPATHSGIIPGTHRSFWVEVMKDATHRDRFRFHALASDAAHLPLDFTLPMMFVSISDVAESAAMQAAANEYNAAFNIPLRGALVPGQKVAYAKPDPAQPNANTALITESLTFIVDAAGGPPRLLKATVRIPQVQELLGSDLPTTIRLFQGYIDHGFDAATGVFAEIVKEDLTRFKPSDPGAALIADTLGVTFSSDKAGGFATPNLGVATLTRKLGPLAGKAADALVDHFDPSSFFPKGGLARLFGTFDLADLLPTAALGDAAPKMHTTTQDTANGKLVTTTLDWQPKVQPVDLGIAALAPDHGGATQFTVHGEIKKTIALSGANDPPTFVFSGQLTNFRVTILSSVAINFAAFGFTARNGAKPDVTVNLDPATPLEFMGDLQFVEELRKIIPPDLFGAGPSLDISPTGIRAGFAFALPPVAVGVFALKDVSLGAALTLPFLDGKPVFDFNVSERAHPFLLTVSLFGGGGFFHLQLDTAGMKQLEAALEFGAAAAIDIGVASGEVHVMAGIYFSLQRKDPGSKLQATLAGYIRLGGSLSVLGLVHISVEFNLTFAYQDEGKAYGRATLTVQVEVAFFHTSVDLTVERTFGGNNGDPKFVDFVTTAAPWAEYAGAFA